MPLVAMRLWLHRNDKSIHQKLHNFKVLLQFENPNVKVSEMEDIKLNSWIFSIQNEQTSTFKWKNLRKYRDWLNQSRTQANMKLFFSVHVYHQRIMGAFRFHIMGFNWLRIHSSATFTKDTLSFGLPPLNVCSFI